MPSVYVLYRSLSKICETLIFFGRILEMNMDKNLLAQYWNALETRVTALISRFVHDSALSDPVLEARHRSFQISHIASGVLATTFLLVYFVANDVYSIPAYAFYFWFASPLLIAFYLSRTGRLDVAQFLSSLNLSGLAGCAAFMTGGINSPLILWLLLVPLEAALSRRRIMTYLGVIVSCLTLFILFFATMGGYVPTPLMSGVGDEVFAFLSTLAAVAYAGGLAGTVQTINRQSSAALNASQESYRFLADNATDLITRHGHEGSVLFASQACKQIIGVSADELERDGLISWIHVADRPAYMRAISTSAVDLTTISVELRIRKASCDGGKPSNPEYGWVEMRCRPVSQVAGKRKWKTGRAEVLAVSRDISLRKAQELELARAKEHAESANRAKSLFVASISHELRTPLNAIIGFSDILSGQLGKVENGEKFTEYCDIIQESGQHLAKIVNDILDLSKIEAGKFELSLEANNLDELITICCETVGPQAERTDIAVDYEGLDWDGEIRCDERAIKQILLNLLSNAVKFSDDGGRVEVFADRVKGDAIIRVVDHGVGISEEDIERLGRPFVQAENEYSRKFEGTGLGLCVVNGLVGLHGGLMNIESEVGVGTTVSIRLPVAGLAPIAAGVREIGAGIQERDGGSMPCADEVEQIKVTAIAS